MPYCSECGDKIGEDGLFCDKCGEEHTDQHLCKYCGLQITARRYKKHRGLCSQCTRRATSEIRWVYPFLVFAVIGLVGSIIWTLLYPSFYILTPLMFAVCVLILIGAIFIHRTRRY